MQSTSLQTGQLLHISPSKKKKTHSIWAHQAPSGAVVQQYTSSAHLISTPPIGTNTKAYQIQCNLQQHVVADNCPTRATAHFGAELHSLVPLYLLSLGREKLHKPQEQEHVKAQELQQHAHMV